MEEWEDQRRVFHQDMGDGMGDEIGEEMGNEMGDEGPNIEDDEVSERNSEHSVGDIPDSYKCGLCHRSLKTKHSFRLHTRKHTKEFHHTCTECKEKFICSESLKEHVAKIHEGCCVCKCRICQKTFKTYRGMRAHAKLHTGELHICKHCGTSYHAKPNLKRHKKTHSKECQCDVCNKKFATKTELELHKISHEESPQLYTCGFCFTQASGKLR